MALRIFNWLRGKRGDDASPPTATEPPAPVIGRPVAAAQPAPVPATEPGSGDDAQPALELRNHLYQEIAEEIGALEAGLTPALLEGDSGLLLADLRGDVASTVRRPPIAAQQALARCRDATASLGVILETFHHDPALTQGLLKHANSPFYATGGGAVASLNDAAQRVGTGGLHNVLLASMVEGLLCRPGGAYEQMVQQVWTHMVRTAPTARRMGRLVDLPPETCYTLGLLHDLGKLIIFDRLSALRAATRQTLRLPRSFLRELLMRLHGPIGGVAALQWSLDIESARAIAAHPRNSYRRYQDSWYGQVGFTIDESPGETMSQVLALAEWWDLTTIRGETRDFDAFWARSGLTLPLDECRALLEES
ncbi:MAG: HDOD domain-containing protein [Gemmatimonadales bacterium]|nr:HDOD domain-containing protein [Gemmatimonadales bacterium]